MRPKTFQVDCLVHFQTHVLPLEVFLLDARNRLDITCRNSQQTWVSQWTSVKCSCRCSCVGGLGCASVTARDHAFFSRQCAPPVGKPLVIGVQTYPRRRLFLNKEFYCRPAAVDVVSVVGSRRRPQHPASQGRVVTYSPPTVADSRSWCQ